MMRELEQAQEMMDNYWDEGATWEEIQEGIQDRIRSIIKTLELLCLDDPIRCALEAEDLQVFLKALVQVRGMQS